MAAKATEATSRKNTANKKGATNKGPKKAKRVVAAGQVHVYASFNNTHVTFTDLQGNKLSSATAGEMGFKGSRKSTPYAAQMAAQKAGQKAVKDYGLKAVDAFVRGPGAGKESALRAVGILMIINSISDVTGIPHNGCRAEKERRV